MPISSRRQRVRFIPAGAGNTLGITERNSGTAVYPRWRGEHPVANWETPRQLGLSPLARGTQAVYRCMMYARRFIPAGAGNTDWRLSRVRCVAVYPRWRGEHNTYPARSCPISGLSPLARGTPTYRKIGRRFYRFIPAGAGNTQAAQLGTLPKNGLSPLARGTRA